METSFAVLALRRVSIGFRRKLDTTHLHKLEQGVVNPHTEWQEESTTRTEVVEDEKLLFPSDSSVITLGSFFHVLLVLGHLL